MKSGDGRKFTHKRFFICEVCKNKTYIYDLNEFIAHNSRGSSIQKQLDIVFMPSFWMLIN